MGRGLESLVLTPNRPQPVSLEPRKLTWVTLHEDAHRNIGRPGFVYYLGRTVLRPLLTLLYRPRVTGREHVPQSGPVLFASNHQSGWDTILIPVASPRPVQFLTKSELFSSKLGRWFFTSIGGVPVIRSSGRDSRAALISGSHILEAGNVVGVFPEGTRSRDGRLHKGHSGAAWMAATADASIVPVGLVGSDKMVPFAYLFSRKYRLQIHFGAPIHTRHFSDMPAGKARAAITEEVMTNIARLSGRERA